MFSGSPDQSVCPFKSVGTLDLHFPILIGARSSNGHSPISTSVAQRMFDTGRDFLRQPGISQVLQVCSDSHRSVILSNNMCSFPCANWGTPHGTAFAASREECYPESVLKIGAGKGEEEDRNRGSGQARSGKILPISKHHSVTKNGKGRDIGYAPAASSCERANCVDACTVVALDAITAFAVPNPNCSSQKQSVFSGLIALQVAQKSRSLSLLRIGAVYFANPFSRRCGQS